MEGVSPFKSVPRGLLFGHLHRTSPGRSRQKHAQGWEQAGVGTCREWKSTSGVVNLAGRVELEGGRESNYQSESGSRTPVIIVFVE